MSLRERIGGLFKGPEEFDLTSGDIAGPLFFLSLPIVVTNLFQTAYNLADTFWLGQYSTEALAAISFAFPMVFLLISLGMGISVAGSVLVAHHTGAGEEREAEYAASQTVSLAVVASVVLGAVGYAVVDDLLALVGASPDVLPLATSYMRIISVGLVFMFGFFMFISLMRGYGDTITPMFVMFGTVVINIALDPFLIFGWGPFPELGITGAAVATIFSRALAMAIGLGILFSGSRGVRIHLRDMTPDPTYARRIVRLGLPASIEGTGRALSINLLLVIVGLFPTTVVAAYGIGTRLFSLIFMPAIAVARGVETMTGQNMGANEEDRAEAANHFAARVMFVLLAAVGALLWLGGRPVVAAFTTDPAVVDAGLRFMRIVAPTFGFIGVMRAYTGGFRGAGETLIAAAISITMLAGIRLPVAWQVAHMIGATGIWVSFAVSNVAGAAIAYLWFRRGTWRRGDLTGGPPGDLDPTVSDD